MNRNRKNRGNGMIWAIILVVIVAVVVTFIIFARARKFDPGKTESGVYLNKWADVRIRVPEGFKTYKNAATDNAHEELYMKTSGTEAAMFGFAAFNDPDVDSGMEQMKQVFLQAAGVSKGVNITVSEVHYPKIAGKEYKYLPIKMSASGITIYMGIYARKVNSHGSFLIIAGSTQSEAALEDLVKKNVSTYN